MGVGGGGRRRREEKEEGAGVDRCVGEGGAGR